MFCESLNGKCRILFISIVLTAICLSMPCIAQPVRVLPLGDSITQSDSSHYSYRYNLWKKLIDASVDFDFVGSMTTNFGGNPTWPMYQGQSFDDHHEGHWGWEADLLLNNLPTWLQEYTPDLVLMHAGTNDVLHGHTQASTVVELKQIIDTLRNDNPAVVIVIAKMIPTLSDQGAGNDGIIALNATIDFIAAEKFTTASPVIVVDQYEGFDPHADLFDPYHPNASGEEKMAQKWFDAIMAVKDAPTFQNAMIVTSDALEGFAYSDSIAGQASDPFPADTITYSKASGPEWLLVAGNGTLTGAPSDADIGDNLFTIRALDSAGNFDEASLTITVNNMNTGEIGLTDFAALALYWQQTGCSEPADCADSDLIGDTVINIDDLRDMAANWLAMPYVSGLTAYWPFDFDASDYVSMNNGMLANSAFITSAANEYVKGSGALKLDGIDDSVIIPGYKGITGTASRTCCAWVKTTATQSGQIVTWGSSLDGQRWMFRMESDGSLGIGVWGGYIKTTTLINDGNWHHVAAVLVDDGSPDVDEIRLYVDGVLDTSPYISNSRAIVTGDSEDVVIGALLDTDGVSYFQGLIDDVRIYDRALSISEIERVIQ